MALKKFDVPEGIDNAISEAQTKEENKENLETAKYVAEHIDLFLKESPNFIQAMKEASIFLQPHQYMAQVKDDMSKTAVEMAKIFKSEIRTVVEDIKKRKHCIYMPVTLFVVAAITMLSLLGFFTFMVILSFKSDLGIIDNVIFWSVSIWSFLVAIFVYVAYKLNW